MNISDKLIVLCIIFSILAILSVLLNCIYFNNKIENFITTPNNDDKNIIKKIIEHIKNNKSDEFIVKYMKNNEEFFKDPKKIKKIIDELKIMDNSDTE